jgi:hypothetical protein
MSDDHVPTDSMASNARRGLELRREYGRGGTAVGVARARDISNKKSLSDSTVLRMHSFFSRHEVDKKGKGWKAGEEGYPSNGLIAWLLWGGDSGKSWAESKRNAIMRNRKKFWQGTAFERLDKSDNSL